MLGDAGDVRVYQFGQVGCCVVIYICVYLSVQRDRSRCLERGVIYLEVLVVFICSYVAFMFVGGRCYVYVNNFRSAGR